MENIKVAWGITGAGDNIIEIKDIFKKIDGNTEDKIHVFTSKAGEKVLNMYQIKDELSENFENFSIEKNSNTPFLAGSLQTGVYDGLIIAPTTSNTIAKIAHGIGDTLLTNSAIMAMKSLTPVIVLPTDFESGVHKTELPTGDIIDVKIREEDENNVKKLQRMEGIHIIKSPKEIEKSLNMLREEMK